MFGQGGFDGPGRYIVRNAQSGLALDLRGNELIQNAARNSPTQLWDIIATDPGVFAFRNSAAGCSLEFDQDRNSSPVHCTTNNNPNQYWRFEAAGGNSTLIISRFRKPLDVPDGTNREGVRLQIYDRNGDSNQRFVLQRVAGGFVGGLPSGRGDDRDRGDRDRGDRDRGRENARGGKYFDNRDQLWRIDGDGVCFYRDTDFRGEAVCAHAGEDIADVAREGGGRFLSVKFFGRAREVAIFERGAFRGGTLRLSRDESNLRRVRAEWAGSVSDAIGSFRVN
jgi:hypothetical protein